MMTIAHTLGARRRGVAAVLLAVAIPTMVGMAALTIDVGHLYGTRCELQNAVDAAALAGASGLAAAEGEIGSRAGAFLATNAKVLPSSIHDVTITAGWWDSETGFATAGVGGANPDAVRVQASADVPFFFAALFGKGSSTVSASATATFATGMAWDVVIVQDVTSSFQNELDEARAANHALLDCIKNRTSGATQIGLVTFTGFAQVVAPMGTVEDSFEDVSDAVDNIDRCGLPGMPPCSGTNIAAGLDAAIAMVTDMESELKPAIVILSDGAPNSSLPGLDNDDLRAWAADSADQADEENISIFTLFYSGGSGDAAGADFLASLVRGEGKAHETPDPDNMEQELLDICLQGIPLALVE